jgi:hypothetical protein
MTEVRVPPGSHRPDHARTVSPVGPYVEAPSPIPSACGSVLRCCLGTDYLDLHSSAAAMSPEEYVARTAHLHQMMGPFASRHPEPRLDAGWGGSEKC